MSDLLKSVRAHFTYEPETGHLIRKVRCGRWPAGARVGAKDSKGHRQVRFQGKLYLEHRLIWFLLHGYWPTEVDHINRVRDDNRLANLRECTHAQNGKNQSIRSTNTSGVAGVSFYPKYQKWVAYIRADGRRRHLGYFDTIEEAAAARRQAEADVCGEFRPVFHDEKAEAAA